MELERDVIRVA